MLSVADDYSKFVPFTARMMAAVRAYESAREDALFHDPFAETLAGEEAFQQVQQKLSDKDHAYIAVRTRFFDNFLLEAQVPQVVLLAAGLDTRAYRLPWPQDTALYELDFPSVLAYKTQRLAAALPRCNHKMMGADLTKSWEDLLLSAGFSTNQPCGWVIEGLLMYLAEDQVHRLLETVSVLSTPGSVLGLDLVNVQSLDYEPYRGYFQYGCDYPEALLSLYGWSAKVVQPGDTEANFGRHPWKFPPRDVQGEARVFLVQATR